MDGVVSVEAEEVLVGAGVDLAEDQVEAVSVGQGEILGMPIEENLVVPISRLQDWWRTVKKTSEDNSVTFPQFPNLDNIRY